MITTKAYDTPPAPERIEIRGTPRDEYSSAEKRTRINEWSLLFFRNENDSTQRNNHPFTANGLRSYLNDKIIGLVGNQNSAAFWEEEINQYIPTVSDLFDTTIGGGKRRRIFNRIFKKILSNKSTRSNKKKYNKKNPKKNKKYLQENYDICGK